MSKKVFVSGCYDMLHSGHVAFFEEAAALGDLYVGLGSDSTIAELKGRKTINTEQERLYMVSALKAVKCAFVNRGSGLLDFEEDILELKPDIFFVNEDGHTPAKEALCKKLGINYVVRKRIPHGNLPVRSTTALRKECNIPYRIDLAGGWLDQPYVSKHYPGPVLTVSIEPDYDFNDRSGMSTSTRKKAIELWQTDIPVGDKEKLARTLFCYENPPGKAEISGSQDSLGIVMPGLNRLDYNGGYWPEKIHSIFDNDIIDWLEEHICLISLAPRSWGYNVLSETFIDAANTKALSDAANECWNSILEKNLEKFSENVRKSFEAQIKMFPKMVDKKVMENIEYYQSKAWGWKLSGAGGGGYLILISDNPVENSLKIRIRRT
ncbi:MAG: adenylyltransferase/cytidyltransferase family protein [Prevotellaceae bacterium]|jgi:cytidyltransferase-like protein|nr:adenylyltransferase/cytidyltransferase family protein [Prevotellaceae bacterium]